MQLVEIKASSWLDTVNFEAITKVNDLRHNVHWKWEKMRQTRHPDGLCYNLSATTVEPIWYEPDVTMSLTLSTSPLVVVRLPHFMLSKRTSLQQMVDISSPFSLVWWKKSRAAASFRPSTNSELFCWGSVTLTSLMSLRFAKISWGGPSRAKQRWNFRYIQKCTLYGQGEINEHGNVVLPAAVHDIFYWLLCSFYFLVLLVGYCI